MSDAVKFGTDGWRARIADDYTFHNVRRAAIATARFVREAGRAHQPVVIGYDRRFMAELFARAAAEATAAQGIDVLLTSTATPTPVISHAVLAETAAAAVNITASHNPPTDLGFKVRTHTGAAVAPHEARRIEQLLPEPDEAMTVRPFDEALEAGRIRFFDPATRYLEYLQERVDVAGLRDAGLEIGYDAMWGVGSGWYDQLLGLAVNSIRTERQPLFPGMQRPEPIPPNIDALCQHVASTGAAVGIAHDGDADRIGVVDETGRFVNQLQVFGLLAYYLLHVRGQRGAIVKTLSTTSLLHQLGRAYGVDVYETGVGFKYVGPKMIETDAMIGGEESGGFAFRGLPERDGILAGLFLLDLIVRTGHRPTELLDRLYEAVGARYYYDRVDTPFPSQRRAEVEQRIGSARPNRLGGLEVTGIDRTDGYKYSLQDGGWMLIRFSGTEPLMRVYTETTHAEHVYDILRDGLRLAGLDDAAERLDPAC
jgi:phosphomannomutase